MQLTVSVFKISSSNHIHRFNVNILYGLCNETLNDKIKNSILLWNWELYGLLYRARGICADMASRVVSGITQSLFSGSRKVCDIFVGSGWPCSLNALSCDIIV